MKKLFFAIFVLSTCILYAPTRYAEFIIVDSIPAIKGFNNYADHLGFKESGNNSFIVNSIGCFSEFQFKQSTLATLGFSEITLRKFKKDPNSFPREKQLQALKALIDSNKKQLEPYKYYIGTSIAGVLITESGLISACHLGGIKSVKKFLLSQGRYILIDGMRLDIIHSKHQVKFNSSDINGTTIIDYIREFQGYAI